MFGGPKSWIRSLATGGKVITILQNSSNSSCCRRIEVRLCSSDLKQRGLRSLISRVDRRVGESLKEQQFSANRWKINRNKDKYMTALSSPSVDPNDEFAETHMKSWNRNPRNMELLGYNKPRGYGTLYRRRDFWNRLNLIITNSHTTAYIDHHTGEILASASTQEFGIARHLWSNTDVNALVNIGRVIAQRCKECGIDRVFWHMKAEKKKEKVQAFVKALKDEGMKLHEPKRIVLPHSVKSDPNEFRPKKRKIKHFSARIKSKYTYK
eukprot:gene13913-15362_t